MLLRRTPLAPARAWSLAIIALGVGLAPDLAAQQGDGVQRATLTGVVVDAGSGVELPGAAISLIDRARPAYADGEGRFSVRDLRPGLHSLTVVQLGYDTLRVEVEVGADPAPLTLRLTPDPVVLERVTALVDRMERYRNRLATSVRVFDQSRLRASGSFDVLEFVRARSGLRPTRCPSVFAMAPCAVVRGRPVEVQVVVDGTRLVAGLDVLATLRPDELHTLEVIGGGRLVRAYTNWFVESGAYGRHMPDAFLF